MSTAYEQIAAFHEEEPRFVSWEHTKATVVPCVSLMVVAVSCLFALALLLISKLILPDAKRSAQTKASYQLTNLLVNVVLGFLGLYYFMRVVPDEPTIADKAIGWEVLYPITCIQMGFQLWALPVGLFVVRESPAMLIHHLAVLLVSGMSAFYTLGFRLYTPLFFGLMELSSVPLAVMNAFKDQKELIEAYPQIYNLVRLVFAFTFLWIRWLVAIPHQIVFLRLLGYAMRSHEYLPHRIYYFFVWASAHFLAVLQLYWGGLIVMGIVKLVLPKVKSVSHHKIE